MNTIKYESTLRFTSGQVTTMMDAIKGTGYKVVSPQFFANLTIGGEFFFASLVGFRKTIMQLS